MEQAMTCLDNVDIWTAMLENYLKSILANILDDPEKIQELKKKLEKGKRYLKL